MKKNDDSAMLGFHKNLIATEHNALRFRERLAWVAERVGSAAALGRRAQLSEATVRQWITGPNEPNRERLVATAGAGLVSAAWLASGDGLHYPFPWVLPLRLAFALSGEGFRQRLRQTVEGYGTATALARACGFSEANLRRWLDGPSEPKRPQLVTLAAVTGVDLEWLLTAEEPPCAERGDTTLPEGTQWFEGRARLLDNVFDHPQPSLPPGVASTTCASTPPTAPDPPPRHISASMPEARVRATKNGREGANGRVTDDPLADDDVRQVATGALMQAILRQAQGQRSAQQMGWALNYILGVLRAVAKNPRMAGAIAERLDVTLATCALALAPYHEAQNLPEEETRRPVAPPAEDPLADPETLAWTTGFLMQAMQPYVDEERSSRQMGRKLTLALTLLRQGARDARMAHLMAERESTILTECAHALSEHFSDDESGKPYYDEIEWSDQDLWS